MLTLLKDLGLRYPKITSNKKRRYYLYTSEPLQNAIKYLSISIIEALTAQEVSLA